MDSARSSGSPQRHANGEKQGHTRQRNACLDDDYMMYTYKVIPCSRVSTHNWKLCHFSHAGEVAARRRNPNCHQADLCAWVSADKECPMGDKCNFAHNAFESWLHPDRFKTTLCSYAGTCTRKFCFFAHCTSELRIPSKQNPHQMNPGVPKTTTGLDTSSAAGTPNSSSSNNSSSRILAQLRPCWTASNDSAVLNSAGGLYLHSNPQSGTDIYSNSSCACTLRQPGGQTLPSLVVAQPQLPPPPAAAAGGGAGPAALSVIVPGMTAAVTAAPVGSLGIPYWDGATVHRLGSTHVGSDSSCQSGHILFDTSASTPSSLTVASVSPNQSPVIARAVTASSSNSTGSSNAHLPALALPGYDCSQQQDTNLRQQLLQHLASLQQQQHQRQQQQQLVLNQCNQAWTLGSRGASNPTTPSLLSMNPVSRPTMDPSLEAAVLPSAAAASLATWPASFSLVSLQACEQTQQQQQQQVALGVRHPSSLAVCQGLAPEHQSALGVPAGFNPSVAQNKFSNGRYIALGDAAQLQQQFNMLSFAMPQPA